jgi:hypothetical protein
MSSTLATTLGGQQGRPNQVRCPIKSFSSPSRSPGAAFTKTDTRVAYGLGFRCSLYGSKYTFITIPMAPVSGPNSFGVDGNRPNKLTSRIYPGAATLFFWSLGLVSCWSPIGARSGTLGTLLAAATPSLEFEFCLD